MNETRRAVLEALAEGPVAGPDLAKRLDISRAAVWKHVEALREAGFGVKSGEDGYRLAEVPEYGGAAVEFGLEAPFDVEYHDAIASTNDRARELAREGASDVAVLADVQTGGRGRVDREWASPSGGVWCSVVLRPEWPPARVPLLTLAAAVAVTRAAREAGVDAGIKWPNDVLVAGTEPDGESDADPNVDPNVDPDAGADDPSAARGGAKLAGVLTEMEGEADRVAWVVVGMGINANVDAAELPPGATSLREQVGDVERRVFVQRVLETLDALRREPGAILDAWRELALTLGERVRIETGGGPVEGVATGVADSGALVVETDDGTERIHAGDCEHLRPAE